MTRTPQLTQQHRRSQDQQYQQPQNQRNQQQQNRFPQPLPHQQSQNQGQPHGSNVPIGHMSYSTSDLTKIQRGQPTFQNEGNISENIENNIIHKKTTEDDINLNPLNLPVYERSNSSFRWIVLILSCFAMFGSYYCFDNPAALSNQLEDSNGEYHLSSLKFNLLYSVYSIPNTILPLFGGALVDKIGAEYSLVVFLALVTAGQAIFAFALSINNYYLMLVGRTVFGFGGESLCVANSALLAVYFRGKEMAFALGLNLSLARAGSSLNDYLTLKIYNIWGSLPFSIWCGFFLLSVCLVFTILMVVLDRLQAKKKKNAGYFVPTAHSGEVVRCSDIKSFDATYWLLALSCVVVYGCVLPWNSIGSNFMRSKYGYSPSKANSRLLIPYLMSAILTPFIGLFVDRHGHRAQLLLISAASLGVTHYLFAWTMYDPLYGLVILGLAYSIYASAIWPAIALVVDENKLGTAYGIITAIQNSGLALIPIAVGLLTKTNKITHIKNYKYVEIFFFGLACLGVIIGFILLFVESKNGNRLSIPSIKKIVENEENNVDLCKDNENVNASLISNDDLEKQQKTPYLTFEEYQKGNLDHTPMNLSLPNNEDRN